MTSGSVTLGAKTYSVRLIAETVKRSDYWVSCDGLVSRSWKPASVTIGVDNVFRCLRCQTHPRKPCIHVEIAQRFLAAQPIEAVPG